MPELVRLGALESVSIHRNRGEKKKKNNEEKNCKIIYIFSIKKNFMNSTNEGAIK